MSATTPPPSTPPPASAASHPFVTEAEKVVAALRTADPKSVHANIKVPAFEAVHFKEWKPADGTKAVTILKNVTTWDYVLLFGPPFLAGFLGLVRMGIEGLGGAWSALEWLSVVQIWELVALGCTLAICRIVYKQQIKRLKALAAPPGPNPGTQGAIGISTSTVQAIQELTEDTKDVRSKVLWSLRWAIALFLIYCFTDNAESWLAQTDWLTVSGRRGLADAVEIVAPWMYVAYVFSIWYVAYCFQWYDLKMASKSPVHQFTGESATSLVFASIPVFAAVLMLSLYLVACTTLATFHVIDEKALHSVHDFVGGGLAFQMLTSNIIFVLVSRSIFPSVLLELSDTTQELEK